jgi:hypothetical protein
MKRSVIVALSVTLLLIGVAIPQAIGSVEDFSGFTTGSFYGQTLDFDAGWSPASTTNWGMAYHRSTSATIVNVGASHGNVLELQNVIFGATDPMPSIASPDLGLGNGVVSGGTNNIFNYTFSFRSSDSARPIFAAGQGYNINSTIRSQIIPNAGVARSGCLSFRDSSNRDSGAGNTYEVRTIGYDTDWASTITSFRATYGTWYQASMAYHANPGFRDDTVDYVIKDELGNTVYSALNQPGWEGAYYDATGVANWVPPYGLPELTGVAFNINQGVYSEYAGGIYVDNMQWSAGSAAVPEPATIIIWSLLGTVAITAGWWRRRKAA